MGKKEKNYLKLWHKHEISAIFSCFMLISPKFAQILKYAWLQLLETLGCWHVHNMFIWWDKQNEKISASWP